MAMTYQNFASLGVNLNRQKYGPLDISNVFTSENDLKYYLTKGAHTEGVSEYWYKNANEKIVPYPYEGQVLATVIGGVVSVYALALDAEGNFTTQEIAGKIEVDGKTIKLNADGKLELVGLPTDVEGKTYVPSYVNGVLTWAEPDTSTAEGQAQEIEGLKVRATALETTVNGKAESAEGAGDAVIGLVAKVAANTEAIADEVEARDEAVKALTAAIGAAKTDEADASGVYAAIEAAEARAKAYADENDANTIYDDTALKNRLDTIEGDYLKQADKYDDTALAGRVATIEGDYLKAADKYDDTALAGRVKALEDEERYDETALANRVTDLETAVNNETVGLNAHEVRIAAMETFWSATEDSDGIVNKLKEIQDYIASDESGAATMAGNIKTNTDAIAVLNGDADGSVNKKIADAVAPLATTEALNGVKATAEAAATKEYTDAELAKKVNLESYNTDKATFAVAETVNAALDLKANTADVVANSVFETFKTENTQAIADAKSGAISDVEAKGYAVATEVAETYATKSALTEAVEGIENDLLAYAKTDVVNTELAKKIETAAIAHTTDNQGEEVKVDGTKLSIFVDAYTKEETLAKIDEKITSFTGGESAADVKNALNSYKETNNARVGAIETKNGEQDTAIAAAQAKAEQGVADAAKVAADLVTANGLIADNTREIGVAKSSIDSVNTTLTEKITALESKDTAFTTSITALETTVGGHTTTVTEHGTKIAALENKDTELATLIQGNTDKFANYYDKDTVDAKVKAAIDAIPEVDFTPYAKTADVEATYAKKADVYTKTEADEAFMTQSEVDARINVLIVGADPEGGKTIENIQNLVQYVDENAGEIAGLINSTKANTEKLAGIDTTVTAYVDGKIAAVVTPKASDEVTVAEDGTLGLGAVSTDKLTMGSLTLVLDGGSAADVTE
jgi:hypothetical protein